MQIPWRNLVLVVLFCSLSACGSLQSIPPDERTGDGPLTHVEPTVPPTVATEPVEAVAPADATEEPVSDDSNGVTIDTPAGSISTTEGESGGNIQINVPGLGSINVNGGGSDDEGSITINGTADYTLSDDGKNVTYDCADGGAVSILGQDNTITLTGPCNAVAVVGNGNILTIDSVETLSVLGNNIGVTVEAVSTISTTGDTNTVTWESGPNGAAPTVRDLGSGNTITQG